MYVMQWMMVFYLQQLWYTIKISWVHNLQTKNQNNPVIISSHNNIIQLNILWEGVGSVKR